MKAIVLLSGGQDSTTCLFDAKKHFKSIEALSFDYGQRHKVELEAAREIAGIAGVPQHLLKIRFPRFTDSALIDKTKPLDNSGGYADYAAPDGLPTSFVPGRNMLFLAYAAMFAVRLGARDIVIGVSEADYSGYPDCRAEFIESMETSIQRAMPSSCGRIRLQTPLIDMSKASTVRLAKKLGDDCWRALGVSLTCYNGQRPGCGTCPSCQLRAKGFAEAGEKDPAL